MKFVISIFISLLASPGNAKKKKKSNRNEGFFLKKLFDVDHFLSLHWIRYNSASVLCFRFLGHEACGILAPRPWVRPTPPMVEGEAVTTGPHQESPVEGAFDGQVSRPNTAKENHRAWKVSEGTSQTEIQREWSTRDRTPNSCGMITNGTEFCVMGTTGKETGKIEGRFKVMMTDDFSKLMACTKLQLQENTKASTPK